MVDETGTNFGSRNEDGSGYMRVYAWSLDDFSVAYADWTAGSDITVKAGTEPSIINYNAVDVEPFLNNDGINIHKATGEVVNSEGTVTASFNESNVVTDEYWQFNAANPVTGEIQPWWIAKVTDENGNDMLLTNYKLDAEAAGQNELSLVGLDTSPSFRTADTTDFETVFDLGSGQSTVAGEYTNTAFWPRIDRVIAPDAPNYNIDDPIAGQQGKYLVYGPDAWTFDNANGVATFTQPTDTGDFFTFDGDDFISDGNSAYGASPVNEQDQIGTLEFGGNTTVENVSYQAERGWRLQHPDTGEEFTIVKVSFGSTDAPEFVYFSSIQLDDDQENINYIITATDDGSPGLDNPGLDAADELAIRYSELICYVQGSVIETAEGPMAVERLRAGDMIKTRDNGYVPLRWVHYSLETRDTLEIDEKRRPVKIKAGALGNNLPEQDLYVSRQHRMLVDSDIAEQTFGEREVYAKAKDLIGIIPGVELAKMDCDVRYYHILLDSHEVIYANGTPSESFYPGKDAINASNMEMRRQILEAVPQVAYINDGGYPLSRMHPKSKLMRACLAEHVSRQTALVDPLPVHKKIFRDAVNMRASLQKADLFNGWKLGVQKIAQSRSKS